MFPRIFFALFLAFNLAATALAQNTTQTKIYTPGETLAYEVKLDRKFLPAISVGDLMFEVLETPGSPHYIVKAEAASRGTLVRLFRQRFFQRIESTIDVTRLTVLRTVKRDEQNERVRESEAIFDYGARKVTYLETDPKDVARAPRTVASSIPAGTQDLVSAVYMLRHLPLAVGKTFEIPVSDSGIVYQIPVRVTGRDLIKTVFGRVWCFRIEPQVFGTGRLIEGDGKMEIWITDDERRMPARAQIDSGYGEVEVKLKKTDAETARR